jgi:hypothetical protein
MISKMQRNRWLPNSVEKMEVCVIPLFSTAIANLFSETYLFHDIPDHREVPQDLDREEHLATVTKWLLEVPNELDVLIAHRDFDKAVECLEQSE